MTPYNISNFIYVKPNALSKENCESIIEAGLPYINSETDYVFRGKDQLKERALARDDIRITVPRVLGEWYDIIQECIFKGYDEYASEVSSLSLLTVSSLAFNWQMTKIGGGFSIWHIEQGAGNACNRALVWSIYLNDIQEGGETEFLYQQRKIKPETGTLVIWPAGITHPHRGNPPYSNDKFILTGWFELPPNNGYYEALQYYNMSKVNAQR